MVLRALHSSTSSYLVLVPSSSTTTNTNDPLITAGDVGLFGLQSETNDQVSLQPPGSGAEEQAVLHKYIVFVICCCGTFGNVLSIAVLTRLRVRRTVSANETVVYYGLILLSVTDLLFCVSILPRAFIPDKPIFESFGFALVYQLCCTGLITTLSLLSTWLIVVTAAVRYVGICHPLRARYLVNFKVVVTVLVLVVVTCVVVNLPTFWMFTIVEIWTNVGDSSSNNNESSSDNDNDNEKRGDNSNNSSNGRDSSSGNDGGDGSIGRDVLYLLDLGQFSHTTTNGYVFLWLRTAVGIFVPLLLLLFFNCHLIAALHRSDEFQRVASSRGSRAIRSSRRRCDAAVSEDDAIVTDSAIGGVGSGSGSGMGGVPAGWNRALLSSNRGGGGGSGSINSSRLSHVSAKNRLTTVLVFIIVFFVLLVYPCEIMDFVSHLTGLVDPDPEKFMMARVVTNVLQVSNFSFNFLLYCTLNTRFRSTLSQMLFSCWKNCSSAGGERRGGGGGGRGRSGDDCLFGLQQRLERREIDVACVETIRNVLIIDDQFVSRTSRSGKRTNSRRSTASLRMTPSIRSKADNDGRN